MIKKRFRFLATTVGRRNFRYPWLTHPVGIMSLASIVRSEFDAQVRVINQRANNLSNETLITEIIKFNPDVVGLSAFTPHKYDLAYICKKLKQIIPNALIIVGGPHASAVHSEILRETDADIAVPGEGEIALKKIINSYWSDESWEKIPGIIWRDKYGDIITNPGHLDFVQELDTLPFPAYDLIDLQPYWRLRFLPPETSSKYITLISSRGCPYGCKWCHNIFGKKFRVHSAERVVEEISFFQKKYGVSNFNFHDDVFNFDHKRLLEICELIQKRNLKVNLFFENGLRADILEESEIDALNAAGMHFFASGLETGSHRLQDFMGKRLNISRYLHNIEYAARKHIFTLGYAMIGFPTETVKEMWETIDTVCSSSLHMASFHTVVPFPGSEIYKMALEACPDKIRNFDYKIDNFASSPFNISAENDDVVWHIQRQANRKFYSPKRIIRCLRDSRARYQFIMYAPLFVDRLLKRYIYEGIC